MKSAKEFSINNRQPIKMLNLQTFKKWENISPVKAPRLFAPPNSHHTLSLGCTLFSLVKICSFNCRQVRQTDLFQTTMVEMYSPCRTRMANLLVVANTIEYLYPLGINIAVHRLTWKKKSQGPKGV